MNNQEWLIVGGLVIAALLIGRLSNNFFPNQSTVVEGDDTETTSATPTIANGQAYYDLHLSLSGTAYNGLSNEYFPLFGFVGARQIN